MGTLTINNAACGSAVTTTTSTVQSYYPVAFGIMYNYYAVVDTRGIASSGWHVPSDAEISSLSSYLGGASIAGGKLKEDSSYWSIPNAGATNETKFNARAGGWRSKSNTTFVAVYAYYYSVCYWWTSTSFDSTKAWTYSMYYDLEDNYRSEQPKLDGNYLRLIKDSTSLSNGQSGTYTGNDGKVYRTICINGVEYLADSLCETKFRNGDIIPWYGANPSNYFTPQEWVDLITAGCCAYLDGLSNVSIGFTFPS